MLRLYKLFLLLYPAGFRLEFSTEMQSVFSASLEDARRHGKNYLFEFILRELTGVFIHATFEHLNSSERLGKKVMDLDVAPFSAQPEEPASQPVCSFAIWLSLLPILLLSLATILVEARIHFLWDGLIDYPVLYIAVLVAAGVAWYKGSPRWSYSYTGFLLVFTWYLEGFRVPAFITTILPFLRSGQLWGKWIWLPVLILLVVVLLARRSWLPVRQFFQNIYRDWTLYTYLVYSTLPWFFWALFDEIHNQPLVVISLLAADLSLWIGAWFYLHGKTTQQRVLALLYAMQPAFLISTVATSTYWHGRQELWMKTPVNGYREALVVSVFYFGLLLIMFFPGLFSLIRRKQQRFRSA